MWKITKLLKVKFLIANNMKTFDNPRDACHFLQNFNGELIIKLNGDIIHNDVKIAEYSPDIEKCGFRRNKK